MSYRVEQAPGGAILRSDRDAIFATEAEAQALLDLWIKQYPGVVWSIESCRDADPQAYGVGCYRVNARWVDGRVHRLPRQEFSRTRG